MSAQVAQLEELLARVQRNRVVMEEQKAAAPVVTAAPAPVEEAEEFTPPQALEPEPIKEITPEPIALTPAHRVDVEAPPLEPEVEEEEIVPAPSVELVEEVEAPAVEIEAESAPADIAQAVAEQASAPASDNAVFEAEATASGPVATTVSTQSDDHWTLSSVLNRAWKLGGGE